MVAHREVPRGQGAPGADRAGGAGRARLADRAARRRRGPHAHRRPARGAAGGALVDRLPGRLHPRVRRGTLPAKGHGQVDRRRSRRAGHERRDAAHGQRARARARPGPAVLGRAELLPRRHADRRQRRPGRLPRHPGDRADLGRRRTGLGRRAALRRPGQDHQRRAEHQVLRQGQRCTRVTYYNFTSDQFTGFHGIVIPGTPRTGTTSWKACWNRRPRCGPPRSSPTPPAPPSWPSASSGCWAGSSPRAWPTSAAPPCNGPIRPPSTAASTR